jgi:nucleotide-binding universal stress UspA family protein
MTYKTILVHLDDGKRAALRLEIAIRLARRFEAHLVGLHALTVAPLPSYAIAEGGQTVIELQRRVAAEAAQRGEAMFRRAVDGAGLSGAEWRASPNDAGGVVPVHARYADLVVIGQPNGDDGSGVEPVFAHRLVMAVGRPVLAIPYAGKFDTLGKRVLVAWSATRESMRAVTDSIPMLRGADEVNVVTVNAEGGPHGDVPGADIALYLARHGVRVKVANVRGAEIDTGSQLLSYAADLSSDLIVMGAYGHARVAELVLGGVTRTIFGAMTVPVLMSH